MNPTSIVIYEDENYLRENLSDLIKKDSRFELKGAFANCKNVEAEMETLQPAIVLMDIRMPNDNDGVKGLIKIKKRFAHIEVIMLTGVTDDSVVFKCIQEGAAGYIDKTSPLLEVKEYIQIVMQGGTMFSPSIATKIREFIRDGLPKQEVEVSLTTKELEVLILLSNGLSQKMIAEQMGITVDGVNAHLRNIFRKLHVHNAAGAVTESFFARYFGLKKMQKG